MNKCPKCGDNHAILLMVCMDGYDLLKCEKCGQQYMFPAEMPKITNGDKLRMMSNEELAHRFAYPCPSGKVTQCTGSNNEQCKACWLKWLNSEVEK